VPVAMGSAPSGPWPPLAAGRNGAGSITANARCRAPRGRWHRPASASLPVLSRLCSC